MKVTVGAIKQIVREEAERLYEQEEESKEGSEDEPEAASTVEPKEISGMSAVAKKVLNPDLPPARFADLDSQMADGGSDVQKAEVLSGYILNYLPGDDMEADAVRLLDKVKQKVKFYAKQIKAAGEEEEEAAGDEGSTKTAGHGPGKASDEGSSKTSGYASGKASDEGSSKTSGFKPGQSGRATDEGSTQTSGYGRGKGSDTALHSESRVRNTLRRMIMREAGSIREN